MADNKYGTIKFKRGTSVKRMEIAPEVGEPIFDTTNMSLYIGAKEGTTSIMGGTLIGPNLNFYRNSIVSGTSIVDPSITSDCFVYYDINTSKFVKLTTVSLIIGKIIGFYNHTDKMVIFNGLATSGVFNGLPIGWVYLQDGTGTVVPTTSETDYPIGYCVNTSTVHLSINGVETAVSPIPGSNISELRRVFKQGVHSGYRLTSNNTLIITVGSSSERNVAISNDAFNCIVCTTTVSTTLDFTSASDSTYNIVLRTKKSGSTIDTSIYSGTNVTPQVSTGAVYAIGAALQSASLDDTDILLGTVTKASSVCTCVNYESKVKLPEEKVVTKALTAEQATTSTINIVDGSSNPVTYIVGSNNLKVYIDDVLLISGTDYTEVGTTGTSSNTITLTGTYYPYSTSDTTISGTLVPAYSGSNNLIFKITEWSYK